MKFITLLITGFMIYFLGACSTDVDFGEQYKKMIYIVNSDNNPIKTTTKMSPKEDGSVTLYCGGSELSGKDIIVQYHIDTVAMNVFNKREYDKATSKYMVAIPEEFIVFHQPNVTIKAGEEYGILNFSINTENLDPGVINTIPISITETSEGEINPKLSTIFYTLQLETPYSGKYNSEVASYSFFGILNETKFIQKTTVALSKTSIRVPIKTNKEVIDGNNNYFDIVINEDMTVTLTSPLTDFMQMKQFNMEGVTMKDVNYYKPETKEFVLCYKQPNTGSVLTHITTYEIMRHE